MHKAKLQPEGQLAAIPLDRRIARQAAEWFILVSSGDISEKQRRDFDIWRLAHSEHERAWQTAMQVSQRAGKLPVQIGSTVLRRPTRVNRRQAVTTLVVLMTAAPAGWLTYQSISAGTRYTTATGVQRDVVLPDGTRIRLNTATEITLAYDDTQRLVILHQGEVLIETATDPLATTQGSRPFKVRTSQGTIRAIGTRFTVRQYTQHSHVGVLEGAVEIKPGNAADQMRLLYAGQQTGFTGDSIDAVTTLVPDEALWARGILAVENMRLDVFVAELSRYRSGIVRCDPAVANLQMTGAFQLNDTDDILQNIAVLLPVNITFITRYWVTIRPRVTAA